MKTLAYIRVSTDKQDVENQKLEILQMANAQALGPVTFLEEVVSGRKPWRERELGPAFDELKKGDAVIVAELSRLGRSMLEIMEILAQAVQHGIRIFAAKGNWALDGSLQSKIFAMVLAMAAEIERDLISQRTKAALRAKAAAGVILGRPKGPGRSRLDREATRILAELDRGVTRRRIAQDLGTTEGNLRNWLKKRGLSEHRNGRQDA